MNWVEHIPEAMITLLGFLAYQYHSTQRGDFRALREEISELKKEIQKSNNNEAELRGEFKALRSTVDKVSKRLTIVLESLRKLWEVNDGYKRPSDLMRRNGSEEE